MSNKNKIEAALEGWVTQPVVAYRENEFDERLVVTRSKDGSFSLFRAFMVGDNAHVSVDLQDVEDVTVLQHLLDHMRF